MEDVSRGHRDNDRESYNNYRDRKRPKLKNGNYGEDGQHHARDGQYGMHINNRSSSREYYDDIQSQPMSGGWDYPPLRRGSSGGDGAVDYPVGYVARSSSWESSRSTGGGRTRGGDSSRIGSAPSASVENSSSWYDYDRAGAGAGAYSSYRSAGGAGSATDYGSSAAVDSSYYDYDRHSLRHYQYPLQYPTHHQYHQDHPHLYSGSSSGVGGNMSSGARVNTASSEPYYSYSNSFRGGAGGGGSGGYPLDTHYDALNTGAAVQVGYSSRSRYFSGFMHGDSSAGVGGSSSSSLNAFHSSKGANTRYGAFGSPFRSTGGRTTGFNRFAHSFRTSRVGSSPWGGTPNSLNGRINSFGGRFGFARGAKNGEAGNNNSSSGSSSRGVGNAGKTSSLLRSSPLKGGRNRDGARSAHNNNRAEPEKPNILTDPDVKQHLRLRISLIDMHVTSALLRLNLSPDLDVRKAIESANPVIAAMYDTKFSAATAASTAAVGGGISGGSTSLAVGRDKHSQQQQYHNEGGAAESKEPEYPATPSSARKQQYPYSDSTATGSTRPVNRLSSGTVGNTSNAGVLKAEFPLPMLRDSSLGSEAKTHHQHHNNSSRHQYSADGSAKKPDHSIHTTIAPASSSSNRGSKSHTDSAHAFNTAANTPAVDHRSPAVGSNGASHVSAGNGVTGAGSTGGGDVKSEAPSAGGHGSSRKRGRSRSRSREAAAHMAAAHTAAAHTAARYSIEKDSSRKSMSGSHSSNRRGDAVSRERSGDDSYSAAADGCPASTNKGAHGGGGGAAGGSSASTINTNNNTANNNSNSSELRDAHSYRDRTNHSRGAAGVGADRRSSEDIYHESGYGYSSRDRGEYGYGSAAPAGRVTAAGEISDYRSGPSSYYQQSKHPSGYYPSSEYGEYGHRGSSSAYHGYPSYTGGGAMDSSKYNRGYYSGGYAASGYPSAAGYPVGGSGYPQTEAYYPDAYHAGGYDDRRQFAGPNSRYDEKYAHQQSISGSKYSSRTGTDNNAKGSSAAPAAVSRKSSGSGSGRSSSSAAAIEGKERARVSAAQSAPSASGPSASSSVSSSGTGIGGGAASGTGAGGAAASGGKPSTGALRTPR